MIEEFDTLAGVPNTAGMIAANTTLTFTIWMRKTANWGTLYPRVRVLLNNDAGTLLCETTGTTALTTTLTTYGLTCTTAAEIVTSTSDRVYLWVGINMTQGPGNKSVRAELDIEGTANGNYDSRIAVPNPLLPTITSLIPAYGNANTVVTIAGSNFGSSQGTSTVTLNGAVVNPTSWSSTAITGAAPLGVTSGPVQVTVNGVASNGFTFKVTERGTLNGTISRAVGGTAIAGALVQVLQSGIVRGSALSAADGSYSMTSLLAGSYDVRVTGSGFSTELIPGIGVLAGLVSTQNVALFVPGSITGTITQDSTGAGVTGASISVLNGGTTIGGAISDGSGAYNVSSVRPGTYTVRVTAPTQDVKEQIGVVVVDSTPTTLNLSLNSAPIQYVYDELGRLVSVTDPSGEAAHFSYDPVGNLLSIARANGQLISVSEFTPDTGPVGTTVTIAGTGFSATPSENTVSFGGVAATILSSTPTQLVASVPAGATTGTLSVTSPVGSTNAGTFSVTSIVPVSITSITSSVVAYGSNFTIIGTGFDPLPQNNLVTINLTPVQIVTVTSTEITATVPYKASAGKVTVATPHGSATSTNDLLVAVLPYAASDVQLTDEISIAGSKSVTISANKIALLLFEGTAGQRVSVSLSNITMSVWRVSIVGPNEQLISTVTNGQGNFLDGATLPVTGTYSLVVAPISPASGSMTLTLNNCPDVNATITPGGSGVPVSLTAPGQNAWLRFEASAGQRVYVKATNKTISSGYLWLMKPDGTVLTYSTNFAALDVYLPDTGTYALVADPAGATLGGVTLTAYSVVDIVGTIAPSAGPASVVLQLAANGWLYFSGTTGQRISLVLTGSTITSGTVSIRGPDGSSLVSSSFSTSGVWLEPVTLTADGTHVVLIDPTGENTGRASVALHLVPADLTGSLAVNGPSTSVPLSVPGQNANLTFSGTANQAITVRVEANSFWSVKVSLHRPDGSELVSSTSGSLTFSLPQQSLPTTGTYTVKVNPVSNSTGSLTLSVSDP